MSIPEHTGRANYVTRPLLACMVPSTSFQPSLFFDFEYAKYKISGNKGC